MKTVVVFTSELVRFEIEATSWVTEYKGVTDGGGELHMVAKLYNGQTVPPVAEFSDVLAVWFKDTGDVIPPEDDS